MLPEKVHGGNRAGLSGYVRGEGSYLGYIGEIRTGKMFADSDLARQMGIDGHTLGHFWKGTFDVTGVQKLGHVTDIMLKAQGQIASRNLDGSEESGLILRVRHQAIRGRLEHWNCVTIPR